MLRTKLGLAVAGSLLVSVMAFPATAGEIKGIIVSNSNGQLTVKTPAGNQDVALPGDASIRSISGPLGGQREDQPATALIPGLPVTIDVDDATGQVTKVEYKASDYKTAAQIQAGVEETARREAELHSAYSKVGEWNVRAEKSVYFATGSAAISADGKKELSALATEAAGINGYVISVLGYADPTGDVASNQKLSARRAQNVINYIKQSGKVLPGKVLAASAMGEVQYNGSADPSTYSNDRRVTVRVVTSKGLLPQQQQ